MLSLKFCISKEDLLLEDKHIFGGELNISHLGQSQPNDLSRVEHNVELGILKGKGVIEDATGLRKVKP